MREIVYLGLELGRKTTEACGKCSGKTKAIDDYVPIQSPMRALTATKRVVFVRHGQGAHNRTVKNWGMVDPELDAVGEGQVADLHEKLKPYLSEVQLVATSPLTRAMQTATGGARAPLAYFIQQKAPLINFFALRCAQALLAARRHLCCSRCCASASARRATRAARRPSYCAASRRLARGRALPTCQRFGGQRRRRPTCSRGSIRVKAWISSRPESVLAVVGHGGLFTRILGYHLKNCGFQWVEMAGPKSDEMV